MRTKRSGWGNNVILYQLCPFCGKKKAYYNPITNCSDFKCTACKKRFNSEILIRKTYD
jgi:predicted  nucleic acid-binding Zn ribbon protein